MALLEAPWTEMKREGYGANFNRLWRKDNLIKKEAKTEYGVKKIINEMEFYKFLKNSQILFPIPEIIEFQDTSYTMVFYPEYQPLFRVFKTLETNKQEDILQKINDYLKNLHTSSSKLITKEEYASHLLIEMNIKLKTRLKEVEPLIKEYDYIKFVNDTPLLSIDTILKKFNILSEEYINSKKQYVLNPIHGDCQFNNILIGNDDALIFIDPRGSYGSSIVYGISEYDEAKILFALSGYDTFDSMLLNNAIIEVDGNEIILPDLRLPQCTLDTDKFSTIICLAVWLGNAHCFLGTPKKAVFSYFYAMWLASSVLQGMT